MEFVAGPLPRVIAKLRDILVGEYNLQRREKGQIRFLKAQLEMIQTALTNISEAMLDQLDHQDRFWAMGTTMTELCYDIENIVGAIMVLEDNELDRSQPSHSLQRSIHLDLATLLLRPEIRSDVANALRELTSQITQEAMRILPTFRSNISHSMLQVLDLEGCRLSSQGCNLKYLEEMPHVRYLGLRDTRITQVPNGIGKLQFLETLDLRDNEISSLPSAIAHLTGLMCLLIGSWTRTPDGMGNLSSLEHLSTLCISDSPNTIEELGHLTKLRNLSIECRIGWRDVLGTSLVRCLQKLQNIEKLSISVFGECNLDGWVAPQHLRRLELTGCWSSLLSSWMNPSLLLNLSCLCIEVMKLQQEDLEILGRLRALSYLDLEVNHENLGIHRRLIIGASSFPCLLEFVLRGSIVPVEFQQGAMPMLESLCFTFPVLKIREITKCDGNFDLGLGNLPSLRNVTFSFASEGASEDEVEGAEGAVRNAAQMHPNCPSLEIH